MLAAFAWFVVGSVGLAVALFDGAAGADRYREVFLTAFVGGWLVQVLLGAWSYLLPMARPGHPTTAVAGSRCSRWPRRSRWRC